LKAIKPAFHDSNTDTDILADSPDIARILARKSGVGVGVVECELDAAHAPICQLKIYVMNAIVRSTFFVRVHVSHSARDTAIIVVLLRTMIIRTLDRFSARRAALFVLCSLAELSCIR